MPRSARTYHDGETVRVSPTRWEWRGRRDGRAWLVVALADGDRIHVEEGPADPGGRRHESGGNSYDRARFLEAPADWILKFPGFHATVKEQLQGR